MPTPFFVLGWQEFPADLFPFVIIFLWWLWVCLHVSAGEVHVCLRTNLFRNMGCSKLELVSDQSDPGVVLCFAHLLLASQIQGTPECGAP